jgi:hypothetical protein
VAVASVGTKRGGEDGRTVGGALRAAGRVALWALVALLLIEGISGVLSSPERARVEAGRGEAVDPARSAFAVRLARAYLSGSSPQELSPLLAPGADAPGSYGEGVGVEQVEVAGIEDLGASEAIVTVAAELDDARTLYLAVPTVRASAGGVAALGVPALVAGPAGVGEPVEAPGPLAGPDAGKIADLARRFLPVYLSAPSAQELSYLLAPGAGVTPPGGGLEVTEVTSVKQLGSGEGPRRTVVAEARVRDSVSRSSFGLAYRLAVTRSGGRWYIARVEGALS